MQQFLNFIFGIKLYMFRTVPLSIIRSFSLYTQQWYMSYRFADSLRGVSGRSVLILLASCMTYTTAVCTVKTPDNGQRNCPKHVEFYSKNKIEKLLHLVGFNIRIYHDARSPGDRQRNCPKYVEFYSKNKFEKLVHLICFVIRTLSYCH